MDNPTLKSVRLALRLTGDTLDPEILEAIEACKYDLKLAGIVNFPDNDPLILQAIKLYAKGNFGFADMGERWLQAYESLKISLSLAGDYNVKCGDIGDIPEETSQE